MAGGGAKDHHLIVWSVTVRAATNLNLPENARPLATYPQVKRVLDVLLAAVLLVCLAPVLLACAVLIALDSRGPILYRQVRVGQDRRPFTMLKFRSMQATAAAVVHSAYAVAYVEGRARPQGTVALYKLANDERVTRVGRWLRVTSLDELPQLWNVIRGEMSLVGPRPPMSYELEHYQTEHFERLAVRPGVTGLWQVSGRSRMSFEEMVALDRDYIHRQSLGLDVRILISTIPVVLFCKDAR
jgi:lipopolysaccharide/colanic/teichoic acid biosynthesis glycosyltransferase